MKTDSGQITTILLWIKTDTVSYCGICFLSVLKNAFLLDWNRYDVWYSDSKPVRMQTCRLFLIITCFHAEI